MSFRLTLIDLVYFSLSSVRFSSKMRGSFQSVFRERQNSSLVGGLVLLVTVDRYR